MPSGDDCFGVSGSDSSELGGYFISQSTSSGDTAGQNRLRHPSTSDDHQVADTNRLECSQCLP